MWRFSAAVFSAHAASSDMVCDSMTTPSSCLGEDNGNAQSQCTWLILDGRCENSESPAAQQSLPSCCASSASGSPCEHHNSTIPEGACQVWVEGSNAAFSLSHALRMLHFAGAAYCDASKVESWSCGEHCNSVSGLQMITYIEHKSSVLAGYVGYDSTQDAIIASFRGTVSTSITDWLHNLAYTKTSPWSEYPSAKVHHGFHNAWEDLKDDVMSAIDSIRATHNTKKVQLTGHSLGGAIAINAAMEMKLLYGLDTSYLDFGRPRAGNSGFAQALASEGITGFRVTHHHDIVPHAPPEDFGFYHTPTEVYYAGSGSDEYKVCDGSGEDPTCSNSCTPLLCNSVSDHLKYMGFTMGSDNCGSSDAAVVV